MAVFTIADSLEALLRQNRYDFLLVGLDSVEEVGNSQRVFVGVARDRPATQLTGFVCMDDGLDEGVEQPQN